MSIDTSTTAGKIAVMQAYEDGQLIQSNHDDPNGWFTPLGISWNWVNHDYRIKPQTVEEAAKIYATTPKASLVNAAEYDFKQGAKWQKEQDQ